MVVDNIIRNRYNKTESGDDMKLEEKLQMLRKKHGYSQEALADRLGIARQTVSKWENGQAVPELNGLILLSQLYGVSIDRIVKNQDDCNLLLNQTTSVDCDAMISFLMRAKKNTYSAGDHRVASSRMNSHDYEYRENEFTYLDTFLGSERFMGSEALWIVDHPMWGMNYSGRVLGDCFDSNFLKEALSNLPKEHPYRGPSIFVKGEYHYHCKVDGEFAWFQGYEEIFYLEEKIYECYFHGGLLE